MLQLDSEPVIPVPSFPTTGSVEMDPMIQGLLGEGVPGRFCAQKIGTAAWLAEELGVKLVSAPYKSVWVTIKITDGDKISVMAERIAGDGALINVYDYRQATGRQGQQELPRDAQVLLHAVKAASSNRPSPVFGIMSGGNPQRDQTVQELIDGTCSSVSTLMTKTGTFNLMLVAFHYKHNCDHSLRAVQTLGWLRPEEVDRAQLRLRIDPTSAVLHLGRARGDEAATQWVQLDTDPSLLNATICILLLAVISSTSAYQGEKMLPKSSFNKLHNDVKSDPDKRLVRMRLWSHIHKVPSPLKEITNDARVMQILKLMQRVYTAQLQGPSNSKE
ncbi:hypothetical protein OC842_006788, partial [Tilletia horrida]